MSTSYESLDYVEMHMRAIDYCNPMFSRTELVPQYGATALYASSNNRYSVIHFTKEYDNIRAKGIFGSLKNYNDSYSPDPVYFNGVFLGFRDRSERHTEMNEKGLVGQSPAVYVDNSKLWLPSLGENIYIYNKDQQEILPKIEVHSRQNPGIFSRFLQGLRR
jgi:hypothetical protein